MCIVVPVGNCIDVDTDNLSRATFSPSIAAATVLGAEAP